MTTNQLKVLADKWFLVFRVMVGIGFLCILLSSVWPIFNLVYPFWMVLIISAGFRMKNWNDKFCAQRDKEYYEGRKAKALNDLGYKK